MNIQRPESSTSEQVSESSTRENNSIPEPTVTNILTRAASLARKGDLLQAESLLVTLSDEDQVRPEAIDLLAKVYAQQGKIDQAQALWLKALQSDPSNIHLLSALRMCAYYTKSRSEHFILQHLWLLISIVLWFIVSMILIISMSVSG